MEIKEPENGVENVAELQQPKEVDNLSIEDCSKIYENYSYLGEDVVCDFLRMCNIATENILDKRLYDYPIEKLHSLSDTEEYFDLLYNYAMQQKKLTEFQSRKKRVISELKKQLKTEQEIEKQSKRAEFLAKQPDFYGEILSEDVVYRAITFTFGIEIKLNEVTNEIEVTGLPKEYSKDNAISTLPTFLFDKFQAASVHKNSIDRIKLYIFNIADKNRYNPIKKMFEESEWDNEDRLEEIYNILGITYSFHKLLVRKWLIQSVALIYNSNEKNKPTDGVLVLQGEQGNGKTSFFRKIAVHPSWFVEGITINIADKDSLIRATSGWICELGEIDSTLKKEQSALKAFITSPSDTIRMPYAPAQKKSPRHTSLCGTVNPKQFLKDDTGSRRFWVVPVRHIDTKKLFSLSQDWLKQFWKQMYSIYLQDENGYFLTSEERNQLEAQNADFQTSLNFELEVRELLDFSIATNKWQWYTPVQIANILCGNVRAEQIGRVLSKIEKEEQAVEKKRSANGNAYLLPVRSKFVQFYNGIGA